MNKTMLALVAGLTLAAGSAAQAQVPGFHRHDGFFLQLDGGFGRMSSSASDSFFGDLEFSGASGQFSVAVGAAVVENFVLAGHFWGVSVSNPDLKSNGVTVASADSATLSGFGLNLTYYFMPANIYVSVTPSIATLSVESGGQSGETNNGFAIRLAAGKEWWVSDNWGVGFNLQFAHSSNEDKGAGAPTWGTNWFGAAFSATFN